LRPRKAEQTAIKILDRLMSSETKEKPVLVHGFSVGGYLYSQVVNQMVSDGKYTPVKERIIGQVFDSPVDFQGIPHGISNAALKHPILRSLLKNGIEAYLKATAKHTSKIYMERSELFFNNPVQSPSLFLFSKSDEVSDSARCEVVAGHWKNNLGIDVTSKCWDTSPHVSHFYVHTNDYVNAVNNFIEQVMGPPNQPASQN
jgi:hypothetical protein